MTQQITPGAAIQMVGTTPTAAGAGASYTPVSGTITTATSTVTTPSPGIGLAGNVTIYLYGTYAGVNVSFEISPDNTNWFPVAATREDSPTSEITSGALTNTARAWTMGAPGFSYVRVRATAWTSGTANVVMVAGTYPFEPMVSIGLTRTVFSLNTAASGVVGVTTEALMSLVAVRGVTAAAGATSQTVTTGKTLRLTSITVSVASSAAAIFRGLLYLRARASGTLVTTDPILWSVDLGTNNALANGSGTMSVAIPDGIDLPSATVFGFSHVATATTGFWTISANGYEF